MTPEEPDGVKNQQEKGSQKENVEQEKEAFIKKENCGAENGDVTNPMQAETVNMLPGTNQTVMIFLVYLSSGLSAWGDRLWTFGIGIFMNLLASHNMRLPAVHGFATNFAIIALGASVGGWIDKTRRLTAARTFLAIQNLLTIVVCAILASYYYLLQIGVDIPTEITEIFLPMVTIALAIVANLASVGTKISIGKDWIVIIANGDKDRLAKLNANIRSIDLLCHLAAPSLAGVIFDKGGNIIAAMFIATWNLMSMIIEYLLLKFIYDRYPALAVKKVPHHNNNIAKSGNEKYSMWKSMTLSMTNTLKGWHMFLVHPVRDAGLGLAFLYMTVLNFDNITYGYCLQQCVQQSIIGALVGVSAAFGVLGSFVFPVLRRKLGLSKTGLTGFWYMVLALIACVVSIGLDGSPFQPDYFFREKGNDTDFRAIAASNETALNGTELNVDEPEGCQVSSFLSIGVFLSGVMAARIGLWIADLSVNQVLQEDVSDHQRGVINGVQNGLNSIMTTVKYILVIFLPNAETFGYLIILSYVFIAGGASLFSSYALCTGKKKHSKEDEVIKEQEMEELNKKCSA